MYTLESFNLLKPEEAYAELLKCCGSERWVNRLLDHFPFLDEELLFTKSGTIWYDECKTEDYLQAFAAHPRIGDLKSLQKKYAETQNWAGEEQGDVRNSNEDTVWELAKWNDIYFEKFGFIFIVFATGKSAGHMLQLLKIRADQQKQEEIEIAMGEQFKICILRLQKLISMQHHDWNKISQITTHVLDTSVGKPGQGLCIKLQKRTDDISRTIALGITNEDGRIPDLLPSGYHLPVGEYQMHFDTESYFKAQGKRSFYPEVTIHFQTFDQSHYHVPLLLNPFGYTTYRGS